MASIRPSRRWFQFSLFSLLLFTTLIALAVAWHAVPAWRQHEAVTKIIELDGLVVYDFQLAGAKKPPGPAWLREWLGDDYFQRVGRVQLERNVDTAEALHAALVQVSQLPTIDFLIIHSRERIDDANLQEIAKARSLKALHLHGRIPDSGLRHLVALDQLRGLVLQDVTDETLAQVARLRQLEHLYLQGAISDNGLALLEPLVELHELSYNAGSLTNELTYPISYDYEDASVASAIEYFHEKNGVTFRFDDDALIARNISPDEILETDSATNIPLRQALERLLAPNGLGFRMEKEALVITTREEAERAMAGVVARRQKLPKLQVITGW
ncbi:MAG TPA: hypothetical protein VGJ26_14770 [Pirellulales bacterium]|jgi:hypothetical protein